MRQPSITWAVHYIFHAMFPLFFLLPHSPAFVYFNVFFLFVSIHLMVRELTSWVIVLISYVWCLPHLELTFLSLCAVLRYQHEDTKRAIIRLEQGAYSYMQRAIASHGSFAILYGRYSKHYIKKPEVCQSTIQFPLTPAWLYDHFADLSIRSCLL